MLTTATTTDTRTKLGVIRRRCRTISWATWIWRPTGTLARARETQDPDLFEEITLGLGRKLTSPQGADWRWIWKGPSPCQRCRPRRVSPALRRPVKAVEVVLDGARARCKLQRLPYRSDHREGHPGVNRPIRFSRAGSRAQVTPDNIFRLNIPGDLNGHGCRDFYSRTSTLCREFFSQRMKTTAAGSTT